MPGFQPFAWINNPVITDGSSCIVIKDSYGNAFVPFLVDHDQTVYVVDYRDNDRNLIDFIKENQVQDVLLIQNVDVLNVKPSRKIQEIMYR